MPGKTPEITEEQLQEEYRKFQAQDRDLKDYQEFCDRRITRHRINILFQWFTGNGNPRVGFLWRLALLEIKFWVILSAMGGIALFMWDLWKTMLKKNVGLN